ncbi:MAG: tail fiber domain-containing protein [Dysgonamonadaceae bacterium]|jgi:hypothetical protein|nr:tail fiber domain-containing protein [Dysgonamonadaceae bacterium]
MKKIICTVIIFAFLANVSAQLKVDSTGRVRIGTASPQFKLDITGDTRVTEGSIYLGDASGFLGTINNDPVRFKVGHDLAGNTGSLENGSVSFGYQALFSNTKGSSNTAIGKYALYSDIAGVYGTAIGWGALYYNTTGSFNTAVGEGALQYNTAGSSNTAIGYNAGVNSGSFLNNATAIGYNARATSRDQVRIGNSSVKSIGGYVGWSNISDKRTKKNIRTDVPGLAFINRLQPVTFNLDLDAIDGLLKIDRTKNRPGEKELSPELAEINRKAREAKEKVKQTGFIAEDVEDTAKSIGYDFSGVDVDETGIYGLRYAEFVVPLVKAVQELGEHNNRLQAQVDELSAIVRQLSGKAGNANDFNGTGGK